MTPRRSEPILTHAERLSTAAAHLASSTPAFAPLIESIGPCLLTPEPDVFRVLIRSVIAQFISAAAARSISKRLDAKLKNHLTPRRLLKLSDEELKVCGIAGAKAISLRSIAEHFVSNRRFVAELAAADDDAARKMLLPLRGVGPWTVDMVLMFAEPWRPDVLPVGDLGIRMAFRDLFALPELPKPAEMHALAEPWRPHRTVACWYLWQSRDGPEG